MRYLMLFAIPLLSACSFSFMQYDNLPVVNATYSDHATKASVMAAGGKPDSQINLGGNGSCLNYTLRNGSESMPFYVAFDGSGKRIHYGYITCQAAQQKGILK
ncbi:TPA: hypothetical protein QFT03_001438 [Kluyvera ascorbata]|uniref:hypothetical protein n=1 Tax=Kluyvera sp. Awk 3 TaxID=2963956 RepID=UPI0013D6FC98|nr:hypothetical protein [Kluyvera sp. Awk 3]MDA8491554.1 hypothetical protein [Kluyvera sp. Awk 3]HDT6544500.1 hypothetical protein [Kluyvera ascorbata]